MSLFSSHIEMPEQNKATGCPEMLKSSSTNGFALEGIADGKTIHFWNDGKVHLHNIMEAALAYSGRANVFICSWSISVPAMKAIIKLRDQGLIGSVSAVVDFRTRKDHPEAFDMARELFNALVVHPCHAKVILLMGDQCNISIAGSANLTNNPKQEKIILSADDEVVNFDLRKIQEMMEKGECLK